MDFSKMVAYVSDMDRIGTNSVPTRRIGVLPVAGFAVMSYAALVEPMRAANLLARRTLYEMINIGLSDAPIASSGAATVTPQAQVGNDLVDADLVDDPQALVRDAQAHVALFRLQPEALVLQVRQEAPPRPVVGMGNIVARQRALPGHLAYFGHRP